MAIHQTHRQTDLEKRLKLLRHQVYGRESVASSKQYVVREEITQKNPHTTNYILPTTDITYFHRDLLKILTFSSIAIGAQIILYFLLKNQVINLNFF